MNKRTCDLCDHEKKVLIPDVVIAFGGYGEEYSFCKKCLSSMTAEEFWKTMVDKMGLAWPLKLVKGAKI